MLHRRCSSVSCILHVSSLTSSFYFAGPLDSPVDIQTVYLGLVLIIVVVSTGTSAPPQSSSSHRVFQGLFAFYQDAQVDSVMAGFKALTPSRANVLRDGQVIEIDAGELVIGDVVKGTSAASWRL
jgi:magnesium-transporting ATPase (P-type)